MGSSLPLGPWPSGWPRRSSPHRRPGRCDSPGRSSLRLSPLFRVPIASTPPTTGFRSAQAASLAVSSPSASSRHRAATCPGGYQPPGTCPLSVSHALRALLRPGPAGLVSCRSRPWGSCPPGSFSARGAARPLGRRCPHGVGRGPGTVSTTRAAVGSGAPAAARTVCRGDGTSDLGPAPGPCSPRVAVSPGRLFRPARRPRPSWASPP